jgi:hypothetical protein
MDDAVYNRKHQYPPAPSMRAPNVLLTLAMMVATSGAHAACAPFRFGYIDQNRPPYYLGNGSAEATPPGASIELIREIAASAGCSVSTVRLPVPRIRLALAAGALIDAAPVDPNGSDAADFAFPLDRNGKVDSERALHLVTVAFVRAADKLPAETDPARYFVGRKVGTIHGASYAALLRAGGILVDDGAVDTVRNLDKVRLERCDAYVVSLSAASDLDAFVAAHYKGEIVRLDKPVHTTHLYLAMNKAYYARNSEQVEAMWNWIGQHGQQRFAELLKHYEAQ